LSRIYSKLGGFEERTRKRTTRNKIPASIPLQMKRWLSMARESHNASPYKAGIDMGHGLEIKYLEWHAYIDYNTSKTSE
jgi:hypothetical protein